jgi:glycosyltransferase involved in cell wall biosynthesis
MKSNDARIRVLYLQPSTNFGGAERQATINIGTLERRGFKVVPMVGPGKTIVDWLHAAGVRDVVHSRSFPGGWPKLQGLGRLALPGRYLRSVLDLRAEIAAVIAREHIDVVFAAMAISWIAATPVARAAGVPIVWRAGGTEASGFELTALRLWAARNRPDLLICCSWAVQRMFGRYIPAPAVVVPNGVDTEQFHPLQGLPRYRPPGASLVVGFSARLVPQKRPDDVIRAAAPIVRRHPHVTFLIAGDGSRRAQYEELARRLGIERQVRFLGYVADMPAFYSSCDIIVLPSRSEGFPNVVLEAMAMRRALIVSNTPGALEVVSDGREALVFPVGDIRALARAIDRLVTDSALRTALAARGQARAAVYSLSESAYRLADLLRRCVPRQLPQIPTVEPETSDAAEAARL